MAEIDLQIKEAGMPGPMPDDEGKPYYPHLTVMGSDALAKALSYGQEFTASITLRVSEISYGETSRIEFEALRMEPKGISVEDASGGEDARIAMRKYMDGKSKKVEPE